MSTNEILIKRITTTDVIDTIIPDNTNTLEESQIIPGSCSGIYATGNIHPRFDRCYWHEPANKPHEVYIGTRRFIKYIEMHPMNNQIAHCKFDLSNQSPRYKNFDCFVGMGKQDSNTGASGNFNVIIYINDKLIDANTHTITGSSDTADMLSIKIKFPVPIDTIEFVIVPNVANNADHAIFCNNILY